ncbi:MAG: DUF748 domain-containing protein [Nitrospirota bacterium]
MKRKKILYFFVIPLFAVIAIAGILLKNSNRILKYELERFLGTGFTVEKIELHWGGVEARNIGLTNPGRGKVFKTEGLLLKADFIGLLRKKNIISDLILQSPYLFLELDKTGKMIFPVSGKKGRKKNKYPENSTSLHFKNISVTNGSLDYLNRKVADEPALTKFRDIRFKMGNISIPPDDIISDYSITAIMPGKMGNGSLKSNGRINLKTKDTKSRLTIRNLDITELRPYYHKKGDAEVSRGFLSVDADIRIISSRLNSKGKITIKDLDFRSGSGRFLGLPLLAVTRLIKDRNNEIILDFTIEGDLENPKFNIRDSIVQKVTLSLAKLLGMPIETIGKSVFELGGGALKKIFR